jgi:hypothetical protein
VRIVSVRQLAALLGTVTVAVAIGAAPAMAAQAGTAAPERTTGPEFKLPYRDPNQAGWLTLCGTNLKPVTEGSITAKPFVWRVVSDVRTPSAWWIKGTKAELYAFQPRPYTPPGAWGGVIMAAPSEYTNRLYPMAQMTPIDEPLTYMTEDYPPIWDHLLELRLYLGAPDREQDINDYAAADIQVIGNTWHLVAGGHSSCTAGKVESTEVMDGLPGASGMPKSSSGAAAKTGTSTSTVAGSSNSGSNTGSSSRGATDAASVAHTSGAGPVAAALGLSVLVVGGLLIAAAVSRRRRTSS